MNEIIFFNISATPFKVTEEILRAAGAKAENFGSLKMGKEFKLPVTGVEYVGGIKSLGAAVLVVRPNSSPEGKIFQTICLPA